MLIILSNRIGSLSTLSTIAGRFTTKAQFDTYQTYLNAEKTNLGATFDSLNNALTDARANLDWDETYMKQFMAHLTKLKNDETEPSSAPIKTISVLVSALLVAVLYILN